MLDHIMWCLAVSLLAATSPLRAQRRPSPIDSAHGRIKFSLGEVVADTTRSPAFDIHYETERPYGCLLTLVATSARVGGILTLSGWHIPPTDVCPSAIGPASGAQTLPMGQGVTPLAIRHLGSEDRYAITIDRELIHVRALNAPRVSFTTDTLIRRAIPGSFAVRCGGTEWFCARAYRELALVPGVRSFTLPATGRNPFGIRYNEMNPPDNDPVHYFISSSGATMKSVHAVLQRVCEEVSGGPPPCAIAVARWMGSTWSPSVINRGPTQ